MKTKFAFTVFIFALFLHAHAQVNTGDSLALVDLYNSTGGTGWTNHTNWLTAEPVKTWYGIEVRDNRATFIQLQYNNLAGKLPLSIGNLTKLEGLTLYNNKLTGGLPSSVANISELKYLLLAYNQFEGTIPEYINRYKNMINLSLDHNRFTGAIPTTIGDLENVQSITLDHNQLTGGIPASIGNLTKMDYLDLGFNYLSDTIPASIGNLSRLVNARFGNNNLSGYIPASFGNLMNLYDLHLNNNQLIGCIPASMGKLQNLGFLNVRYNHLSGQSNKIPTAILSVNLDLRNNNFTFTGPEYVATHIPNGIYLSQARIDIHHHHSKLAVSAGGTLGNNTYTWFRTGMLAPAATVTGDSTFQPAASGQYYARVTNSIASGLTLKTDTVYYSVSGNDSPLSLLPNPAIDNIFIRGLNDKTSATITIADINGHVRIKMKNHQQSEIKMDVSWLKAGNYLVNVGDGKELKTIQFVKQ